MAYYISAHKVLRDEIADALDILFNYMGVTMAEITKPDDRTVVVKVISGHPTIDEHLSGTQLEDGVIGGGRREGLNGKTFTIHITMTEEE